MSPVADAELNFVLERILKHPEIIKQVVPEGGTWKQVVDKLNTEQHRKTGNAATLYNKAVLGKGIIDAIAAYTPADFENDSIFSAFISKVDAFITTQSILQRKMKAAMAPKDESEEEPEHREEDTGDEEMPAMTPAERAAKPSSGNGQAAGEWEF